MLVFLEHNLITCVPIWQAPNEVVRGMGSSSLDHQKIARFIDADVNNPHDQFLLGKLRGRFSSKGLRILLLDWVTYHNLLFDIVNTVVDPDEDFMSSHPAPEEINETSFREYSQYGAPGMLHNIGLQLRASPQLYEQFRQSQRKESGNDSTLHWVFNNATRWDSDMRMMERALLLRPALNTFFNDVQNRWETESGYESTKPRVLQYRLSAYDWKAIEILVKLLKPFEIATKQLQGNGIPGSRSTCGSFDEYFPVFEILLITSKVPLTERYWKRLRIR